MKKQFKKAIILDIFDLNYGIANEEIGRHVLENYGEGRIGLLWRITSFLGHLILEAFKVKHIFKYSEVSGGIMVFVDTINQKSSLTPLIKQMENVYLAGRNPYYKNLMVKEEFPLFLAYLLSLIFFPVVILHYLKSNGYRKRTFNFIFDKYWLTYGYYLSACLWMDRLKPNVLIVSNDHNMPNRVIVKVAKEKMIPSIYIQHASVTDKFPPLKFDYAFLEGIDALHKYEHIEPTETKVFLVGMIKIDENFDHQNTNEEAKSVGICTNLLDPLTRVRELCNILNKKYPTIRFYLRPHPADKRDILKTLAKKYGMKFSNSRDESSLRFLQNVDVIIAGDSNIILEAALINVYPIYYDFALTDLDGFGFQGHGLVEYFSDIKSVCRKIEELMQFKPIVRSKAKRYCYTVNTRYDGRSTELVGELIQAISNGQEIDMKKWRRISNMNLDAFELDV